jgi:hypothetical protein
VTSTRIPICRSSSVIDHGSARRTKSSGDAVARASISVSVRLDSPGAIQEELIPVAYGHGT